MTLHAIFGLYVVWSKDAELYEGIAWGPQQRATTAGFIQEIVTMAHVKLPKVDPSLLKSLLMGSMSFGLTRN